MALSFTESVFALCGLATMALAAVAVAHAARPRTAVLSRPAPRSARRAEIVWALVPVVVLALVMAAVAVGTDG